MIGFCLHPYKGSNFEKMNFRPIPNHWGHKKAWRVMSATSSHGLVSPASLMKAALETQVFRSQVFWSTCTCIGGCWECSRSGGACGSLEILVVLSVSGQVCVLTFYGKLTAW